MLGFGHIRRRYKLNFDGSRDILNHGVWYAAGIPEVTDTENDQNTMETALTVIAAEIKTVLESARRNVARQVNSELLNTYRNIGRIISEYEQTVPERADYGKQTLKEPAKVLTAEFGKGFSRANLKI